MRHRREGRKLKRTASHRKALMRILAMQLFEYKKIHTTEAKAKELRPFAESLITRAKKALANESQGQLPDGQSVDVHARRIVAKDIKKDEVLKELFDAIAPAVEDRNGGYTRIVKTGFRRGDAGSMAIIELVDFAEDPDPRFVKKKASSSSKDNKSQSDIDTFENIDESIEDSKNEQVEQETAIQEADNQDEGVTEEESTEAVNNNTDSNDVDLDNSGTEADKTESQSPEAESEVSSKENEEKPEEDNQESEKKE